MLNSEALARRRYNDSNELETRDRKSIIFIKEIREMKKILKNERFKARALT